MPTYREAIENLIREQALPVEKYGHQPRLYALARTLANPAEYDDDILHAAAWLHDLGVFIGHRPEEPTLLAAWDSTAYTLNRIPNILTTLNFPPEKIEPVVEAIRTHQPFATPTTIEGIILRDADILEQLGAIGILRTVCKVGRDTRFSTFTTAIVSLQKALETLPAQIKLESARELAKPRINALKLFLDASITEAGTNFH